MIPIGASLAAARRARGLELRDAERLTCMRARYLTALEEERFDDLPGRTYARAFLRTYASALGLDSDKLLVAFDDEVPGPEEEGTLVPFPAPPHRSVNLHYVAPALAAAAVAAILLWAAWSQSPSAPPALEAQPPAAAAAVPPAHQVLGAAVVRRSSPVVAATPSFVLVRAVGGPCWIEARRSSSTGPLLAQRLLAPGESVRFDAPRVWLRLGAPWNALVRRGAHVLHGLSTTGPQDVAL